MKKIIPILLLLAGCTKEVSMMTVSPQENAPMIVTAYATAYKAPYGPYNYKWWISVQTDQVVSAATFVVAWKYSDPYNTTNYEYSDTVSINGSNQGSAPTIFDTERVGMVMDATIVKVICDTTLYKFVY